MLLKDELLLVADTYAEAAGIGRKRVSTIVLNRGATLDRVADGAADVTTGTFEKAMRWFSDNWPADTAWPKGVNRPSKFPDGADRVSTAGAGADLASAPALSIPEAAE